MKYDDASWHTEGKFPAESPPEWGGVHIGVFVRLMFLNGFAGELHTEEFPEELEKITSGEWTGTKYLYHVMDGKMTDEDFSDRGNSLATQYYCDEESNFGQFIKDVAEVGGLDFYKMPEEKVNMSAMEDIFSVRVANFEATGDVMRKAQ